MLHFVRRHSRSVAMRILFTVIVLLLAGLLIASVVGAQSAPRSAAVLLIRGGDTILVQRSIRSASSVQTVVAGRGMPRVTVLYTLTPSQRISRVTFSAQGPGTPVDAPFLQRGTLELGGDTAHIEIQQGERRRVIRPATSQDALPLFNNDFTALEQGVRLARAAGVRTLEIPLLALANGQTVPGALELFAPDSVRFTVAGNVTVASIDSAGNVTGGYLPGQNVRLVVLTGGDAARVVIGAPDYSAPTDAPYTASEVTVKTPAGHSLAGTLTLPTDATGRIPAVVTITGSGQQDRDEAIPIVPGFRPFRQVADTLSRRGIAVLRLDDRAVGGSGGDPRGTSADFADDIRAAVAFLREHEAIDPARIALVGHSEGGMIAPMVAATDPQLAAIVLMAGPAFNGRDIINFQIRSAVASDPDIAAAARDSVTAAQLAGFDSTAGKLPWMQFFLAHDPMSVIKRVKQPVLILQGATDLQVTADQAPLLERALRDAGNSRVTAHVFSNRNHLFLRDSVGTPALYHKLSSGRVDGEVMGTLADWLDKTLGWESVLDSTIIAELARTKTPGASVAIAQDGKVIYAKGFGVADIETSRPVTAQTLFRVGSVTKMVTGAVLAELSVAGKLDLQAPIGRYVKELEGRRVADVTAHQLLTHSAGWLDNAIPYGRMGEGALGEVMREVTDTLFFTEPGRVLSYSNPGFSMAGYVAEQAGGKRFGDLADEFVLRKMGMPHATFRPLRALTHDFSHGHVGQAANPGAIVRPFTENTAQWAAGFLMASAQDMARFAIALLDNGMLDGQRVLSEEAVRLVTTGYTAVPGDTAARYGYGVMIGQRHTGDPVWQHGGSINGFDAQVTMYPRQRLAFVLLDNRSGSPMTGIAQVGLREIAKLPPAPESDDPVERVANARERAQLVGRYVQNRIRLEIVEQGDSLLFKQGMAQLPVRLVGDDRIVLTPPVGNKITLLLVRDETGRVAYLSQGLRAIARQP